MRCQKCGYTSFDYLSECSKCGGDLSSARDALGFLPVKPEIPFFLAGLLKDADGAGAAPKRATAPADLLDTELPEFNFDDELELGADEHAAPQAAAAPGPERMKNQLNSALKVMQDIEQPAAQDADMDIDFLLDDEPGGIPARPAAPAQGAHLAAPEEGHDDLTLELSDEDLQKITQEVESHDALRLEPVAAAPAAAPDKDDNLTLDLSDADLESLLLDLDATSPGGQGKK